MDPVVAQRFVDTRPVGARAGWRAGRDLQSSLTGQRVVEAARRRRRGAAGCTTDTGWKRFPSTRRREQVALPTHGHPRSGQLAPSLVDEAPAAIDGADLATRAADTATCRSSFAAWKRSSASSSATYSPVAVASARFRAADGPAFACRRHRTRRRRTRRSRRCRPSSRRRQTTTSTSRWVCASTRCRSPRAG